jgi:hypothetical protein
MLPLPLLFVIPEGDLLLSLLLSLLVILSAAKNPVFAFPRGSEAIRVPLPKPATAKQQPYLLPRY